MVMNKLRRARILPLIFLLCSSLAAFMLWTKSSAYRNRAQGRDSQELAKAVQQLEGLRQKYAKTRSVHISADARIDLYGANRRSGSGSYEYWAQDHRYKMMVHTAKR